MTFNLRLYAAPVALLLMATGLAVPRASAETAHQTRTVTARFEYNPSAPAGQIYADLKQFTERLCSDSSTPPLFMLRRERACVATAMQDAIGRMGRVDIADLHSRPRG